MCIALQKCADFNWIRAIPSRFILFNEQLGGGATEAVSGPPLHKRSREANQSIIQNR